MTYLVLVSFFSFFFPMVIANFSFTGLRTLGIVVFGILALTVLILKDCGFKDFDVQYRGFRDFMF